MFFNALYPHLSTFSEGTYTRVRNGKKEIVRKNKKRNRSIAIGGGIGALVGIADGVATMKNPIKVEKLGRFNNKGKFIPSVYSGGTGFAGTNKKAQLLIDLAPAIGAAAGYGYYKLRKNKRGNSRRLRSLPRL